MTKWDWCDSSRHVARFTVSEHLLYLAQLTIKGVTKPVTVDFEDAGTAVDPYGNTRIGFEGSTTVSR